MLTIWSTIYHIYCISFGFNQSYEKDFFAMTNRVTIRDVARYADVSMSTVSQILNGKANRFSNDTCQKVLYARDALGYVPDFNARNLITNSVKTIGVIVPDIGNPFFSTFIKSIELLAMEQNCISLILSSNANQEL